MWQILIDWMNFQCRKIYTVNWYNSRRPCNSGQNWQHSSIFEGFLWSWNLYLILPNASLLELSNLIRSVLSITNLKKWKTKIFVQNYSCVRNCTSLPLLWMTRLEKDNWICIRIQKSVETVFDEQLKRNDNL